MNRPRKRDELLPFVILEGSPADRGRQHGRRFGQEINAALVELRSREGVHRFESARQRAENSWQTVLRLAPVIASEIEGIAAGSETHVADILLHIGFEFLETPGPSGCSAIAVKGVHGAIVAQNWDALPGVQKDLALFFHVGLAGFEQAVVASLGGLAWVGCNRNGLALVTNDLMLRRAASGLPSQIVRRLVLEQSTVADALQVIAALPHMGGRSYLLGDAMGDVAGIEISAGQAVRVNQRRSPVLHTNHALDADIRRDEDEAQLMRSYPSSRQRYDVLKRVAADTSTVSEVAAVLNNQDGFPNAIWKAPSADEPTETAFSVIVDCGSRILYIAPGSAQSHSYHSVCWR